MKNAICATDEQAKTMRPKKNSRSRKQSRVVRARPAKVCEASKSHSLDLSTVTGLEKKALQIALGVLRSGSDYGDFLNFWLQDYGRQVLSPYPPPPLLPELSADEERLLALVDAPTLIQ